MKVGFAGAGNMAGAMARGWAGANGGPDAMTFCDLDRERAETLAREVHGEVVEGLTELARGADLVVLAVKPAALDDVAAELGEASAVLSVLAMTPLARLHEALPGVPVIRVMPNQPVEVRRGVLCYVLSEDVSSDLAERVIGQLNLLGTTIPVQEQHVDAAMAVMSSSPAYVALVSEALSDAGEKRGLEPRLAHELVVDTLAGTAELLRIHDPEEVRRKVASPGGATEKGLRVLEERALRAAIDGAVHASMGGKR
jgi:pyrroline-5-carboxylate reductase